MKAQDLRVHNQIENGIVVTIQYSAGVWGCIVTQSLFSSGHDWQFVKEDELKPIPLSPEWLIRLGADTVTENEDGSQNYWSRDNDFSVDVETHILVPKLEMLFYYRIDGGLRGRRLPIINLHQLQNLYFALTGSELTLKP